MIIGQESLIKRIDAYKTFPSSVLIIGETGSGKHLIVDYISKKLNKDIVNISDKLNLDTVFDITLAVTPYIYLIDKRIISPKEQFVILKLLEEPPVNATIVILTERLNYMLPTIQNRCQIFTMEKYSKEVLKTFVSDDISEDIVNYLNTPGQILSCKTPIKDIVDLCNLIIDKIAVAAISNTFTIANKIDINGKNPELINHELFIKVLIGQLVDRIIKDTSPVYGELYKLTNKYFYDSIQSNADKSRLFDQFLIDFKNCIKYGH